MYFENNYDTDTKARFSFSSHFSFKDQVTTTHNSIPLKHEWTGQRQNEIEKKCLGLLYSYLEEALQSAFIVEYFTSINGDEDLPIALKRNIHWGDIKSPNDLILEDREFWEITL